MMHPIFSKFDLTGKTAVVTGGGTGIGYNMSRALACAGAKVMIASRREPVLQEAAKRLTDEANGNVVLYRSLDLSSRSGVDAFADAVIDELGGVDIYIGNAAIDCLNLIENVTAQEISDMLQVNLAANVQLVQKFLPHMRKKHWGRVLFSSSVNGVKASPDDGTSIYAMCKSGLNGFARVLAAETGRDGVTVNSIILGMFRTDMVQQAVDVLEREAGPEAAKAFLGSFTSMTALEQIAECGEIEGSILLLASEAGRYITGSEFNIDGGMNAMIRPLTPRN